VLVLWLTIGVRIKNYGAIFSIFARQTLYISEVKNKLCMEIDPQALTNLVQ